MHIVMISDVYFPRINGVSTSIRTFCHELEELGHDVTLIVPDYGKQTDDESWIFRVPSRGVVVDPEDRMMHFNAVLALEPALRELRPDILHIQTPFIAHYAGVRLARNLRIPSVLSYHTYFEEYLDHYIRFLPRFVLRWAVRYFTRRQCSQVDAVVVPTRAFDDELEKYGVCAERYVNPTGIDLVRFNSGNGMRFRQEYDIDSRRPCLLFVGRLAHEKNIGFLLQVVAEVQDFVPDILFIMAGEGPAEVQLRALADSLGLEDNVRFIGYLNTFQSLRDCYCAADAFIFASRTETQGLVLLEAMALGVPVVSTAKMGTRDILRAGRGALVVEEDRSAFASAILRLLGNGALRHELGKEGREYVNEWSASTMAMRLEDIYLECVESTPFFGRMIGNEE